MHVREDAKDAYRAHLASLTNTPVEIIIRKARSRKSQEQLGWYWGCILALLADRTGHTEEEMHAYCAHKFLNPPMLRTLVIADDDGEVVEEVDVQLQADRVSLLRYATSGEVTGDNESVVGYGAAVIWRQGAQPGRGEVQPA